MRRIFSLLVLAALLPLPLTATVYGQAATITPTRTADQTVTPTTTKTPKTDKAEAQKSLRTKDITALKANRDAFEAARLEKDTTKRLTKLKEEGAKAIDRRLAAIAEFEKQMGSSGRCAKATAATKATITAALASVKTSLAKQKTDLAAATTYDAAKVIVKAIFEDNRVFAHLLPAAVGLCASDLLSTLTTTKLTAAIAALKKAGYDTTAIEASIATAKTAVASAKTFYEKVVKAPGAATANADLVSATKSMKEAKTAMTAAKTEIEKALVTLRSTKIPTTTTTP